MPTSYPPPTVAIQGEPRWPALLALLATGALYLVLPEQLTAGPSWVLLAVIVALLIPAIVSRRLGHNRLNHFLGFASSAVITMALAWSFGTLVARLPGKRQAPADLLRSAAALWLSNVLVFACWYWRLDAGGPHARDLRPTHTEGAFLFPQMMLKSGKVWKPGFVDYLFLAFNTSTAFSPTDVPVLSRWAKLLMMVQSSISLGTLAILAARAINIL
jgi:hypothetical protein